MSLQHNLMLAEFAVSYTQDKMTKGAMLQSECETSEAGLGYANFMILQLNLGYHLKTGHTFIE